MGIILTGLEHTINRPKSHSISRLTSFLSAPSSWTSLTDWHSTSSLLVLPYNNTALANYTNDALQAFINTCLWKTVNVHWPDRISNNEPWKKTSEEPVQEQLWRRKWKWPGQTLRRSDDNVDKKALQWTSQGCRQCDFRFDYFLVLVLVFQLFFSFSFVLVLQYF